MAFQIVKASALPETSRGRRRSHTPKIAITAYGRMTANTFLSVQWAQVDRVLLRWDAEGNRIAIQGLDVDAELPKGVKAADVLPVTRDKKNGVVSFGAGPFLDTMTDYKYLDAGHQSFTCEFIPAVGYVFELPAVEPVEEDETLPPAKTTTIRR